MQQSIPNTNAFLNTRPITPLKPQKEEEVRSEVEQKAFSG
jgi:hypothetical protein